MSFSLLFVLIWTAEQVSFDQLIYQQQHHRENGCCQADTTEVDQMHSLSLHSLSSQEISSIDL
jgi:hypothetical protein